MNIIKLIGFNEENPTPGLNQDCLRFAIRRFRKHTRIRTCTWKHESCIYMDLVKRICTYWCHYPCFLRPDNSFLTLSSYQHHFFFQISKARFVKMSISCIFLLVKMSRNKSNIAWLTVSIYTHFRVFTYAFAYSGNSIYYRLSLSSDPLVKLFSQVFVLNLWINFQLSMPNYWLLRLIVAVVWM